MLTYTVYEATIHLIYFVYIFENEQIIEALFQMQVNINALTFNKIIKLQRLIFFSTAIAHSRSWLREQFFSTLLS